MKLKLLCFSIALFAMHCLSFGQKDNTEEGRITNVTPKVARVGERLEFTITGESTHFTQASSTVYLKKGYDEIYFYSTATQDNNTLKVSKRLYNGTIPGIYDLYVLNTWDGKMVKENAIEVVEPKIKEIVPNEAYAGKPLNLTIVGENTDFTQASTTVAFVDYSQCSPTTIFANAMKVISKTEIDAEVKIPFTINGNNTRIEVSNRNWVNKISKPIKINNAVSIDASFEEAYKGETVLIRVTGTNTDFTKYSNYPRNYSLQRYWHRIYPERVIKISKTELELSFHIPQQASYGNYSLIIQNEEKETLTECNVFNLLYPELINVENTSFYSGKRVGITVETKGLNWFASHPYIYLSYYQQSNYYRYKEIYVARIETINQNKAILYFDVPYMAESDYAKLNIYPGGSYLRWNDIVIKKPEVNSITPQKIEAGIKTELSITGKGLDFIDEEGGNLRFVEKTDKDEKEVLDSVDIKSVTKELVVVDLYSEITDKESDYSIDFSQASGTVFTQSSSTVENKFITLFRNEPSVKSITPNELGKNQITDVKLIGKNTRFTKGVSNVMFSLTKDYATTTLAPAKIDIINDTTLTLEMNIGNSVELGSYDLVLNHIGLEDVTMKDAITVSTTAGTDFITNMNEAFSYYPNPVRDVLTIEYVSKQDEEITIRISNTLGVNIFYENARALKGMNEFKVNFKEINQAKGIYYISIIGEEGLIKTFPVKVL